MGQNRPSCYSVFMETHSNSFHGNNRCCLYKSQDVIFMSQFVMHFSSILKEKDL